MKQFAVIGLGNFSFKVAVTLSEKGCQVIAIDKNMNKINDIKSYVTEAISIDVKDKKTLSTLGLENMDAVLVGLGESMEASILTTLYLKEMNVKNIIVKAMSRDHAAIVTKLGATRTIIPEEEMAIRLANSLVSKNIIDHIPMADGFTVSEITAPSSFVGKTIRELLVRNKYKVEIIAIRKGFKKDNGEVGEIEKTTEMPTADTVIEKNDIILVFGKNEDVIKLQKL